jgi:hypothetical protein
MENDNNNEQEPLFLFGDVTDFDLFKAQVQSLFVALSNEIQKRLDENKASLEKVEEQFALLYAGYAEQAAVIENLLLTMFTDNPEKEKIFRNNLAETRRQFLNLLKEGAQDVLASEDPNIASAIESVVDEKLSD